jgi:hypothetical protein
VADAITRYRIQFHREAALDAARCALEAEGFAVTGTSDAPQTLDAHFAGLDADADAKLQAALEGIDHDPVIEWYVERMEFVAE